MRAALLIVDMQQGSFADDTPRYDTEGVVNRVNELAERVRAAGGLVVFIQHDGPPGDKHHPDAPGWKLLATLKKTDNDPVVRKTSCDAFLDTELDGLLRNNSIGTVLVTGCATDYCVDTTVRSAMAHGYVTIVPSDGHTTADRAHLSAEKIIEHHNAIWANFYSPVGPARVTPCTEIEI